MQFSGTSSGYLKHLLSLSCGLILSPCFLFGTSYNLPTPIGGPVQLNPATTFPDPILADLDVVMDNFFQPPWYPGNYLSPTYLQNIYYLSNAYIANNLTINPINDKLVHVNIGQNQIIDNNFIFRFPIVGTNTRALSSDNGTTWSYNPPIEQTIPLGGTISQLINASLGPGLFEEYAKNGTLYASGWGFFDMTSNPPHLDPLNGFLFTSSEDSGANWETIKELWPQMLNGWFFRYYFPQRPFGTEVAQQEFYTTVDPANSQIIHCCTTQATLAPLNSSPIARFNGKILYFRSEDGGETFSAPVEAYSLIDNPDWVATSFDTDMGNDLEYLNTGGPLFLSGHPRVFDDNTILIPIVAESPRRGVRGRPLFNYSNFATGFARSFDNGKTWSHVLGLTEPGYQSGLAIYDPGFVSPSINVLIRGQEAGGYFFEGQPSYSRNMLGTSLISASTGRVYLVPSLLRESAPHIGFVKGRSDTIAVTSSSDKGATWTPYAQINRTPTDIPLGAQQAFSQGAALSSDGWFVISYYDFRNWTGFPGEIYDNIDPDTAPPLPTDAWLAVYKETQDPLGGSTGVGLDFVGEIRLTQESFNARAINMSTAQPYTAPFVTGTPEGVPIGFNNKNELFVIYSTQTPGSQDNIDISSYKGMTVDTNGYYNLFLQRFQFPKPSNQ